MTLTKDKTISVQKTVPVTSSRLRLKGIELAIGSVEVGDLFPLLRVAHRDPFTATGYQRNVSPTRVKQLTASLKSDRVDLPTAVLLNIRDFDTEVGLEKDQDGSLLLRLGPENIWVVDGQHRLEALRALYEAALLEKDEKAIKSWGSYTVPFVCMLGANELQETEQFYNVNTFAKSVGTDLAYDILKTRAETDPGVMEELIEAGKDWIIAARAICHELSQKALWQGRIRFSNQSGAGTTINSSGFINSMQPLLASPFFQRLTTEGQVKVLEAYWDGIQRVLPEAFNTDPTKFSIQRSLGVQILHKMMLDVIEVLRAQNKDVTDPEAYADVVRDSLINLSGESLEQDRVSGVDFWRSGKSGAAGSFSSNAGRRVLVSQMKRELPKFDLS